MEGRTIKHISFYSGLIETMGYEPQRAVLEIRLMSDRKIRQYDGVPEEIWYKLRNSHHPDTYYRRHICGCYEESILPDESAAASLEE